MMNGRRRGNEPHERKIIYRIHKIVPRLLVIFAEGGDASESDKPDVSDRA